MCLSPANPYTIPATARSSGAPSVKSRAPSIYGAGVYYDRHVDGYIAYIRVKSKREKFVIGTYLTYSEALIERLEFLKTI